MQKYAKGSRAWGICGRSGRKMLLKDMIMDGRYPNMRVDPAWYEDKHPMEFLPKVEDPVALYRPAPEVIDAPDGPALTLAAPTYPSPVLSATVVSGPGVQLNWTVDPVLLAPFVAHYAIYKQTNSGPYTLLTTVTAPTSTYTDSAVVSGNQYSYFIVALAATGAQGSPSNIVSQAGSVTDTYTTNGTWTKRTGAFTVDVLVIAGGGGAGAGQLNTQGFMSGGQAGAGGGLASLSGISAATFPSTVAITVGLGGAGKPAGDSSLSVNNGGTSSFGTWFTANGGQGGQSKPASSALSNGGTASSTLGGATLLQGGSGGQGNGSFTTAPNTPDTTNTANAPSGGGGGGAQGIQHDSVQNGGQAGNITSQSTLGGLGGLSVGLIFGANPTGSPGGPGNTAPNRAGSGGGGGGSALNQTGSGIATAGKGGNGGNYGGGGGGGGGALSGTGGTPQGGAGGDGAPGIVVVTTHFW